MSPREQAEILAVADELDRFGMKRNAARLRALLGDPPDDERPCAVQDNAGQIRAIPWGLAEILYPAYGHSQSLERMHERGGFGRAELGMLAADCYGSSPAQERPRLKQMPLLTLYQMATQGEVRGE